MEELPQTLQLSLSRNPELVPLDIGSLHLAREHPELLVSNQGEGEEVTPQWFLQEAKANLWHPASN